MKLFRKSTEAYAKINLLLRIEGMRGDGYHLLSTVMHSISISDNVEIEIDFSEESARTAPDISLVHDLTGLPSDAANTMYRAADAYLRRLGSPPVRVLVRAQKRIPTRAGLGGGSTDAAAVLRLMNEGYSGAVNEEEMIEIAEEIGADVPFFINGGAALCEGIGERITPVKAVGGLPVLIMKPSGGVSTPEAYQAFDRQARGFSSGIRENRELMTILSANHIPPVSRIRQIAPFVINDLQDVAIGLVPEISGVLEFFEKNRPVCSAVSGSGSAVFAIFDSREARDRAQREAEELKDPGIAVFPCETID